MTANVQQLQKCLQYQFKDQALLTLALTHRSCGSRNNERLEFLGDSVLGVTVTEILYRKFPTAREGELSRLRSQIVRAEALADVAKALELSAHLHLGSGELKSGGHRRDSILGDTVEALIGAIYLESGLNAAQKAITNWFKIHLDMASLDQPAKDPKTRLQEWLQQRGEPLPEYNLVKTGGEAHSRIFTVSCRITLLNDEATASASSRRKAEQQAAQQLLASLEASSE